MKKTKKCYRTMTADNYTPMNCMEKECTAWLDTNNLSGCVFVLHAATSIGRNLDENKKGTDNGDDGKDSACDGQCEERGAASVEEGGERNNDSDTVQEDIQPTEGGNVPKEVVPPSSVSGDDSPDLTTTPNRGSGVDPIIHS